jgi:hypothetical protein
MYTQEGVKTKYWQKIVIKQKKKSQITQPGFSFFFQSCCRLLKFGHAFQNFSNSFGKFTLLKPECKIPSSSTTQHKFF